MQLFIENATIFKKETFWPWKMKKKLPHNTVKAVTTGQGKITQNR